MDIKVALLLMFFACLMLNCNNSNTEKQISDFPSKVSLKGIKPNFINSDGINPSNMNIYDSLIIVGSTYKKNGDNYIHIINNNTFQTITSAGRLGKGPSELTNPIRLTVNKSKGLLNVWDDAKRKIFVYNIDSMLNNPDSNPVNEIKITSEHGTIYEMIAWDDTIVTGGKGSALLHFIDANGRIKKIGLEHVTQDQISDRAFSKTLRKKMSVNETYKKLILGYRYYDRISLMNDKGEIEWSITGPDNIKPNFRGLSPYNSKVGYSSTTSFDKYILGLYSGKEIGSYNQRGKFIPNYANEIHVLSLKGMLLGKFYLDREITSIEYDKNKNKLIALESGSGNPFVIYDLPMNEFNSN